MVWTPGLDYVIFSAQSVQHPLQNTQIKQIQLYNAVELETCSEKSSISDLPISMCSCYTKCDILILENYTQNSICDLLVKVVCVW